jgi:hypothetical protein
MGVIVHGVVFEKNCILLPPRAPKRLQIDEQENPILSFLPLRIAPICEDAAVGVEFIGENGGGPGVRLRKPTKQKR